jgi:hypothetical protein
MVTDWSGVLHVIWEDEFDGMYYTFKSDEEWSIPIPVSLPFDTTPPILLATQNGRIHAFWIQDDELLYSRVAAGSFADRFSWIDPEVIGRSALKAEVIVDHQDLIHVAYVRTLDTPDSPAGIYYRRSEDMGVTWSVPANLYASPYMRGLNAASAHISLASGTSAMNQPTVYAAWDNRPLKQVFLAVSTNAGRDWGEPVEIDRPEPGMSSGLPFNIQVTAYGWNVLLVWQNGDPNTSCTQYYQWSPNQGDIWIDRQSMDTGLSGCASENRLVDIPEDMTLLISNSATQLNLLVWNGIQWSDPQVQRGITTFTNPATYESVNLGCRRTEYDFVEDLLLLTGCDTAGGGDVWFSSRPIGDVTEWFPPDPIWKPPSEAFSGEQPFLSPVLFYGPDERLHAMWTQLDDTSSAGSESYRIYYARYDQRWTRPAAVLTSPDGRAGAVSTALTADERMLATWSDGNSGKLYFSWTSASRAMMPSEWMAPQEIPVPLPAARSPFMLEAQGMVYVAYALPLNEGRGVFLTTTRDLGHTWSEPAVIFDAAAAGWAMVDQPRLALAADGSLHALFTRFSLPGGSGPLGLFYARSEDRGQTWSTPERVVERPVSWSRLVFHQMQGLHRLWQETSGGRTQVVHQYSPDYGLNWSRSITIGSASTQGGAVDLALDSTGRLHLLQLVQDFSSRQSLQHWLWEGSRWALMESLLLSETGELQTGSIHAAISPSGVLSAAFSHLQPDEAYPTLQQMSFSYRSLELPTEPLAALPPIPTEPAPTPGFTPSPPPAPTPTMDFSAIYMEYAVENGAAGSPYLGLFLGVGLALGLVGAAVGVGVREAKKRGR